MILQVGGYIVPSTEYQTQNHPFSVVGQISSRPEKNTTKKGPPNGGELAREMGPRKFQGIANVKKYNKFGQKILKVKIDGLAIPKDGWVKGPKINQYVGTVPSYLENKLRKFISINFTLKTSCPVA